uniref:Uncharacterized protein n=1 Tax=Manihot esculenta TaxID=3983 RepID=A0A2C9VQR5_MANES
MFEEIKALDENHTWELVLSSKKGFERSQQRRPPGCIRGYRRPPGATTCVTWWQARDRSFDPPALARRCSMEGAAEGLWYCQRVAVLRVRAGAMSRMGLSFYSSRFCRWWSSPALAGSRVIIARWAGDES